MVSGRYSQCRSEGRACCGLFAWRSRPGCCRIVGCCILGNGRGAIVILGGMLIAMILLFLFARLLSAKNTAIIQAAVALMWMVVIFVGVFLFFTATAFAINWPTAWAQVLGIETANTFDARAMEKLLDVPKQISTRISSSYPSLATVRLQPQLENPIDCQKRNVFIPGGGSYYSFARRTHDYNFGSDISFDPGLFMAGWAGSGSWIFHVFWRNVCR
jgi:hypothetical protein